MSYQFSLPVGFVTARTLLQLIDPLTINYENMSKHFFFNISIAHLEILLARFSCRTHEKLRERFNFSQFKSHVYLSRAMFSSNVELPNSTTVQQCSVCRSTDPRWINSSCLLEQRDIPPVRTRKRAGLLLFAVIEVRAITWRVESRGARFGKRRKFDEMKASGVCRLTRLESSHLLVTPAS